MTKIRGQTSSLSQADVTTPGRNRRLCNIWNHIHNVHAVVPAIPFELHSVKCGERYSSLVSVSKFTEAQKTVLLARNPSCPLVVLKYVSRELGGKLHTCRKPCSRAFERTIACSNCTIWLHTAQTRPSLFKSSRLTYFQ